MSGGVSHCYLLVVFVSLRFALLGRRSGERRRRLVELGRDE